MILTIDIGLKNLALCAMSCANGKDIATYKIEHWEVYNVLDEETPSICNALTKKQTICGKRGVCKYNIDNQIHYTCKTHFPKTIPFNKKNHIVKVKLVKDYLLQDIARLVILKVTEIYHTNKQLFEQASKVVIELQPKVNNKMKLISHIIFGKLVELYAHTPHVKIRFVSASQKLKAYKGPPVPCHLKTAYARRKYLSIRYTLWFLTTKFQEAQEWLEHFEAHPKKDDLADTFLMSMNALCTLT